MRLRPVFPQPLLTSTSTIVDGHEDSTVAGSRVARTLHAALLQSGLLGTGVVRHCVFVVLARVRSRIRGLRVDGHSSCGWPQFI